MHDYKLIRNSNSVLKLDTNVSFPQETGNGDYKDYLDWLDRGNIPHPPDDLTPEELQREDELIHAGSIARQWFKDNPAAIDFLRQAPSEQATQIRAMSIAQKDNLLIFLTVAVSALVKREYL